MNFCPRSDRVANYYNALPPERQARFVNRRRKKYARKYYTKAPVIALDLMREEFPEYQYDDLLADLLAKRSKKRSYRKIKTTGFDWRKIKNEIPEFFYKCWVRQKTKAVLHLKGKEHYYRVTVSFHYYGGHGEGTLLTDTLVKLFTGDKKTFLSHPAVQLTPFNENFA